MNTIPYRTGTLHHALAQLARKSPRRTALVWEDTVFTWEDLYLESLAMAEAFGDAALAPGELVAAWGTSAPFHVVSLCAAGMVEAVHMPLNPRWPGTVLREFAAKATLLISDGRLPVSPALRGPRVLSWSSREHARPRSNEPRPSSAAENSPVAVDFTRGRSGVHPRGALLTHTMVLANAAATGQLMGLGSSDSVALLFPAWQHPHELISKGLATGCTSVVVDFPYPRTILSLLGRHTPTWVIGSPRVIEEILPFGDRVTEAVQGVRGVLFVGDYARPRLVARLAAAGLTLLNGWGSAETAGVAVAGPITAEASDLCGTPCAGYEASIRSASGAKEGELVVRGNAVSLTYLDRRSVVGAEGWFATGDVVRVSQDGSLRLMGRPGEAVLGEGRRVSLARLEMALSRVPGVSDVAAVIPTQEAGTVAVYVEPAEGMISLTPIVRRLRQFFGSALPEVFMVPALPRTSDGRIDKAPLASGGIPAMGIEAIDRAILELLNRRASISATARSDENPLAVDEAVLQRMVGSNAGPLFDDAVREIYRCILDHCRRT